MTTALLCLLLACAGLVYVCVVLYVDICAERETSRTLTEAKQTREQAATYWEQQYRELAAVAVRKVDIEPLYTALYQLEQALVWERALRTSAQEPGSPEYRH